MEFLIAIQVFKPAFVDRHIGARRETHVDVMFKAIRYPSVEAPVALPKPENLGEIDRFLHAMTSTRAEIVQVATGNFADEDSPLRNASHTAERASGTGWSRSYSPEQAAFPVRTLRQAKYFPPVGRIDGAAEDRNLACSRPPLEAYEDFAPDNDNQGAPNV